VRYSSISLQPPSINIAFESFIGAASQPAGTCCHDGHDIDLHRKPLWSWLPTGIWHNTYPWDVRGSFNYLCFGDLAHGRHPQSHCEEIPKGILSYTIAMELEFTLFYRLSLRGWHGKLETI